MTDEAEQLRALIREAHEAAKDLKAVIREARTLVRSLEAEANAEYVRVVTTGLEAYHNALNTAIEDATDRVYARFDLIAGILMGEDPKSRREGKEPLDELVRRYMRKHDMT